MKGSSPVAIILVSVLSSTLCSPIPASWCDAPSFEEASFDQQVGRLSPGDKLKLRCNEDYKEMDTFVTCQRNGTWSDPDPECQLVSCPPPDDPPNGSVTVSCHKIHCNATYSCQTGFWYDGTKTRSCERNESWSSVPGHCKKVQCPPLPDPPHGQMVLPDKTYQARAVVVCDESYVYTVDEPRHCQADGTWDGQEGKCEAVVCPTLRPEVKMNGELIVSGANYSDTAFLECSPGYTLSGQSIVMCQSNGTWSATLGHCLMSSELSALEIVGICVAIFVPLAAVVGLGVWWFCFHRHPRNTSGKLSYPVTLSEITEETVSLIQRPMFHCSFILTEDFSTEYSETSTPEYQQFSHCIKTAIKGSFLKTYRVNVEVKVCVLCKKNRTAFIDVECSPDIADDQVEQTLSGTTIRSDQRSYNILSGSVTFRDRAIHNIVADIQRKRHTPDKHLDRTIDLDTQYVRLKLLSTKNMGIMHRDTLERPDLYQQELEKQGGKDIQDEDLIEVHDVGKYILVRGRAGIGKSTLIQRLIWKWANGEWATKFKLFVMLNLRHLMNIDKEMSLSYFLSLYGVYNTGDPEVIVDDKWLKENQCNIGLILDGIDEIQNFKEHWQRAETRVTLEDNAKPLCWCFALMKRVILKESTLIISSRPFADLGLIRIARRGQDQSKDLMMVELMGLTRERVLEFVDKNTPDNRKDLVKQKLEHNPILMSVSAITFYCAALCYVLGVDDVTAPRLTTYTMITAYIMQVYIKRSMRRDGNDNKIPEGLSEEMWSILSFLSKLACDGFLNLGPGGLPRLVFEQSDLDKVSERIERVPKLQNVGLLMETDVVSPDQPQDKKILWQFVHLSLQEFLAMAGLLNESPEKIAPVLTRTMTQLSRTGQYNMALLFLYGMAFDEGNSPITNISKAVNQSSTHQRDVRQILLDNVGAVTNTLQALQIAHESRSSDVVQRIGDKLFGNEIAITSNKLTAIDVIAITFFLKHHRTLESLRLIHVGIDRTSVGELANFLAGNDSVKTLELKDETLDDVCVMDLMEKLKQTSSLQNLILSSTSVTDLGAEAVSSILTTNTSLTCLSLKCSQVTDKGVKKVADALLTSTTLQELIVCSDKVTDDSVVNVAEVIRANHLQKLSLTSDGMTDAGLRCVSEALLTNVALLSIRLVSGAFTDDGAVHLCKALTAKETLRELSLCGFYMAEKGAKALLNAVKVNHDVCVTIWTPECNENLLAEIEATSSITCE